MFKKLYTNYRKWKQRDFLKWRDNLSDYERDFFMPEIKGRCEELLKYCKLINDYSTTHTDEVAFGATLRSLIMDKEVERLVPANMRPPKDEALARHFFTEMKRTNQETFIEPLEKVIAEFDKPIDLKRLGSILNQVNHVCATVLQVKEKLFLYALSSFATVRNLDTNELVLAEPKSLSVMLMPFRNTIENIHGVATSTSGTIHQWHKEQMEWKNNFLKVLSERLAQRNNLITIIVAVSVSWVFLTINSPFEKIIHDRETAKVKDKIVELLNRKIRMCKLLTLKMKRFYN